MSRDESNKARDSEVPVGSTSEGKSCGLIMPISAIDGSSADHWAEVKEIISSAVTSISSPRFSVRLVSDADEIGIIQRRIVHNVYSSDIVVCDVSGKNPNVMFELGMRLAFDKPVVIVKDDKTDYSFDTAIIEHLTYPRDLRFSRIVAFKEALATKVAATYQASLNTEHSPFLKNFGQFHVAALSSTEVSPEKLTLEMIDELRRDVARIGRRMEQRPRTSWAVTTPLSKIRVISPAEDELIKQAEAIASEMNAKFTVVKVAPGFVHLDLGGYILGPAEREKISEIGASLGVDVFVTPSE